MIYKNYDPERVSVNFAGIELQAPMSGVFIKAERNEDSFKTSVGAAGDVTRVRSRNRTGTVTVTLQAGSPSNDLLSAVALADEQTGAGVGPLQIVDLNGTTLLLASLAWIKKLPTIEFGDDASGYEWEFECAELDMIGPFGNVGGAVIGLLGI